MQRQTDGAILEDMPWDLKREAVEGSDEAMRELEKSLTIEKSLLKTSLLKSLIKKITE